MIWSRPLGTGHSAILVDDGRLYTMYRAGNGRAQAGPVGRRRDRRRASTRRPARRSGNTSIRRAAKTSASAPARIRRRCIVGDRLFTIGTNKQVFAFDKRTGKVLWSHDLIKEFDSPELLIRPVVKVGYGCSPIAYRDTIICSVGGPGQSVMAFRQSDGAVVWKSGDFLTSDAPPILIEMGGRDAARGLWRRHGQRHGSRQRPGPVVALRTIPATTSIAARRSGVPTTSCSCRRPTRPAAARSS